MVCNDFGDFPNNPLSFGFNSVCQKTRVFDFPGATGLEKDQGQGARLENFEKKNVR
jgi:hypothetical protein